MPKSKRNKDSKERVQNFKNQQKNKPMSENTQVPQQRQISQLPVWNNTAEFKLNGNQFMALQNFFNLFQEPLQVMTQLFNEGLNSGTIQMRYQDQNGTEVSQEEVNQYVLEIKERFEKEAAEAAAKVEADSTAEVKSSTKSKKSKTISLVPEATS